MHWYNRKIKNNGFYIKNYRTKLYTKKINKNKQKNKMHKMRITDNNKTKAENIKTHNQHCSDNFCKKTNDQLVNNDVSWNKSNREIKSYKDY
ncbi:hypothetical protein COBT_003889, partial [Conglomerata obtusa]